MYKYLNICEKEKPIMSDMNVDEVLDVIGFGYMQLWMMCTSGCICVCIMNEIMGITIMAVSIACEFALTDMERSFLTNAGFMGMIIFGHYSGYATDMIGRRRMVLYSIGSGLITSLISLAMPNFYLYLVLRFLVGSLLTGASVANLAYIIENTPIKLRPRIVTFISYFLAVGYIYVPCMANFFGSMKNVLFSIGSFDIRMWRFNMLVSAAPGVIAFISMIFLPESSKYLFSVGKDEQALSILNRISRMNRRKDLETLGVASVTQPNLREESDGNRKCFVLQVWLDTIPLFKPPYRRTILLIIVVLSSIFFVGNGLGSWFMQLRQRMPDAGETVCQMLDDHLLDKDNSTTESCWDTPVDYIDGVLFGCTILILYIIISLALFCVPRKSIMFAYLSVAIICGFSLNFLNQKWLILCAFILFLTMCSCCTPLVSSITCDAVPTHIRGTAISITITIARLHVVVASQVVGAFLVSYCYFIFNIFVAVALVPLITTYFLPK